MPRKPREIEVTPQPVTDAEEKNLAAMADASRQLAIIDSQRQATVRAVAEQIGYLLPADCTDPDLIQRDIAANMRRSVEACLEVGRGLRVLKEACEHGQFIDRLDVLGLDRKVAARFIQSAAKFSNVATSRHLIDAIGSQSKLFEMLVLDDEQIEELALTGHTGELALDDVSTMSVKELRSALRDSREDVATKSRLLSDKTTKIDQLSEQLVGKQRRVKEPTPDEEGAEIRKEATVIAFNAEAAVRGNLREAFKTLAEHGAANGADHNNFMVGLVCQIEQSLGELRDEYSLNAKPTGDAVPDWMKGED